ncbi:MAG: 3-dehydroquinate synthase [Oscillospiraceae bacterium]|nr:3-dehydroquinate synthase [Oscillospiraceae bacterium]
MIIPVNLPLGSYEITIERGVLKKAKDVLNLDRKVLIVTDSGVPEEYSKAVAAQSKEAFIETIPMGEESKSLFTFEKLSKSLLEHGFTRSDCVVAVGGGVCGDLAGFVAASYMRGIDFYNIPTTVLSQVDSSVGGKTAVNFMGVKNIIGAFYQPKAVLIDPDTLKTLSERHFSNGLAEAVKMSLTFDKELFELFESSDAHENIETIIEHSIKSKIAVVEQDEKEAGLRKVLNFGHTMGHAIESAEELGGFYHGECVALGMLPMCAPKIRKRLIAVLKKLNLPTEYHGDIEKLISAASHDKKFSGKKVTVITLPEIENFKTEEWSTEELFERMKEFFA